MFIAFLHSASGSHIFKICRNEADLHSFIVSTCPKEPDNSVPEFQLMLKELHEQTELTFDYVKQVDDLNNRNRDNLRSLNPVLLQLEKANGDVLFVSTFDTQYITDYINKDSLIKS